MEYPSKVIKNAVEELSTLPGIGRKTALRLVLHILKRSEDEAERLGMSIVSVRRDIKYCKTCHNIADTDSCNICESTRRSDDMLCVVEDSRDVIAIESTAQFRGRYHILGGLISPLQGVGPSELNIDSLIRRIKDSDCKEVIFAFGANIEGDTTAFFLAKRLEPLDITISSIARGIPVGMNLEYTDEVTLARSMMNRTPLKIKN